MYIKAPVTKNIPPPSIQILGFQDKRSTQQPSQPPCKRPRRETSQRQPSQKDALDFGDSLVDEFATGASSASRVTYAGNYT